MKLAFKRKFGFGFSEKDVEITLNIGTLEAVCEALNIAFYQISASLKNNDFDFLSELLFQGYITACKNKYQKPKYNPLHSIIWREYLSVESQKELQQKITVLFGDIEKTTGVKKKVEKKTR
jgi:hypothetical protein